MIPLVLCRDHLCPHISTSHTFASPKNGVTYVTGREFGDLKCFLLEGRVGRALFSCSYRPLPEKTLSRRTNPNSWKGQDVSALCIGAGDPCCPSVRTSVPRFRVHSQRIQPLHSSLPFHTPRSSCPLHLNFCHFWSPSCVPKTISCIISLNSLKNPMK